MFCFINGNNLQIGGNYKPNVNTIESFFDNKSGSENKNQEQKQEQEQEEDQETANFMRYLTLIYNENQDEHTIMPIRTPKVRVAKKARVKRPDLSNKFAESEENRNIFLQENKIRAEHITEEDRINQTINEEKSHEIKIKYEIKKLKEEEHRSEMREQQTESNNILLSVMEEKTEKAIQENIIEAERIQKTIDMNVYSVHRASEEMGEALDRSFHENINSESNIINNKRNKMSEEIYTKLSSYNNTVQEMKKRLNTIS